MIEPEISLPWAVSSCFLLQDAQPEVVPFATFLSGLVKKYQWFGEFRMRPKRERERERDPLYNDLQVKPFFYALFDSPSL